MPVTPLVDSDLICRKVVVRDQDVVYVKGIFEASEGLGALFAEHGGDLVVAADNARFSEIFVRRGLSIDGGGSWSLPRVVGLLKAKELALLADVRVVVALGAFGWDAAVRWSRARSTQDHSEVGPASVTVPSRRPARAQEPSGALRVAAMGCLVPGSSS